MNEKDLKNYNIRTDLVIDLINDTNSKDYKVIEENFNDIKTIEVDIINKDNSLNKKQGKYITITYNDITDKTNIKAIEKVVTKNIKKLLKHLNIKDNDTCLIVGLGNINSTCDALGPKTIEKVLVTRYLYEIPDIDVDKNYRNTASIIPGVTGNTGIESSDIILGIIDNIKPDFLIVVDSLASSSIDRVNKTVQMTDTGINPGSGVYNNRKELSYDTLNIPVISIGIPTVIEAFVLVSDTISYLSKYFSYNKDNFNKNKLIPVTQRNYQNYDKDLSNEDKKKLLGEVGNLTQEEVKELIFEVLTPIGYNMMVTPKEIDFVVDKASIMLSNSINKALHKNFDI